MSKPDFSHSIIIVFSGADSIGHEGEECAPHFYKWLGMRGTVNRKTANKKLTKL